MRSASAMPWLTTLTMPRGRFHDPQPQGVRHVGTDHGLGCRGVDGESSSEQMGTAQASEHHVRVGDRRAISASAVAGRAGLGARARRADAQRAARIDPGDAAAARAHLRQIDDRHADGVPGAVQPAPDVALAADLVLGGGLDAAVLDEARLGGGAAHVEGDEVRATDLIAEALRGDDPGCGSGLDRGGGHPEHLGHVQDPAVRPHDVERREIELGQGRRQAFEVGGEHWSDVGAHGGGARALELPDLGQDLAGEEYGNVGQGGPQPFADPPLVGVVEEREHQAYRDGLDAVETADGVDERVDLGFVEGGDDLALGIDSLGDLEPPATGNEDRGGVLEEVVEIGAGGAPNLEHVAESAGGDQRDIGALRFEQGVGDDGGGVREEGDRFRIDAVLVHRGAGAFDDGGPEVVRGGRDLGDSHLAARLVEDSHVGERPADIDSDTPSHRFVPFLVVGIPAR